LSNPFRKDDESRLDDESSFWAFFFK
jgi:hypothetical protein